jgi:hypothetical protein
MLELSGTFLKSMGLNPKATDYQDEDDSPDANENPT